MTTLQNFAPNRVKVNWHSSSILHTNFWWATAFLFTNLLHSKGFRRYVAANVSFGDLTPYRHSPQDYRSQNRHSSARWNGWRIGHHRRKERSFLLSCDELWQSRVNWRTATSYNAMQALIAALKRNPTPTRSGVQQALSASDFSATGASDTIKFLSSSDRNGSIQLVEIRPSKTSRTGYDFEPIRWYCQNL